MLELIETKSTDSRLLELMKIHYSQPKGFVGRRICYAILYDNVYYGHILAGSSTLNLPGRHEFLKTDKSQLVNIVNNTFYHIRKVDNKYPIRNFSSYVVSEWRKQVEKDWLSKYGDAVLGFESLVELPRTGELYLKDDWTLVGQTKGYTCKRVAGQVQEKWNKENGGGGVRVWDYENLRPKLVFCKKV